MRSDPLLFSVLMLGACRSESVTNQHTTAPPTLQVTGANRVVSAASVPELEVSALLRNATRVPIQVAVGAQCPLFVRLFPDSTGTPKGSLDPSMACAAGAATRALAPGDTAILSRIISSDSLAALAPGVYGINIAVTTSTALLGAWAGSVRLPLAP